MLELQNISAGYSNHNVLHEVSLPIAPGTVTAIIGPNGCGKSTLLRVACGLLRPTSGHVVLESRDLSQFSPRERARQVALLPQRAQGGDEMTVLEMTLLGRTPHLSDFGAPSQHDKTIAQRALEQVNALDLSERRLNELSGGQRQRVLMARALAQEAPILLLDEPTSNLDLRHQFEILKLARDLTRSQNAFSNNAASTCTPLPAVVVVLHHLNLAANVADAMLLLNTRGEVLAQGAPQDVVRADLLQSAFEMPMSVEAHPISGRPQARALLVFE